MYDLYQWILDHLLSSFMILYDPLSVSYTNKAHQLGHSLAKDMMPYNIRLEANAEVRPRVLTTLNHYVCICGLNRWSYSRVSDDSAWTKLYYVQLTTPGDARVGQEGLRSRYIKIHYLSGSFFAISVSARWSISSHLRVVRHQLNSDTEGV